MAIQQNNKIIASEINSSAATNFNQGAFIYASDIASLYGGTDNIAKGVLIRAEHFQNLGLPGSGGLNGTFNGVPFKNAIADSSSGLEYVQDSNGWTLYITKNGTINFTNFGRYGNNTDIFMIGGGGAGNMNGLSGSGGFYINGIKKLNTNESYELTISAGGTTNGAHGGGYIDDKNNVYGVPTRGFGYEAKGGQGGIAHTVKSHYRSCEVNYANGGYELYYYEIGTIESNGLVCVRGSSEGQTDNHAILDIICDQYGSVINYTGYIDEYSDPEKDDYYYVSGGNLVHGNDGYWYIGTANHQGGPIRANITPASRPQEEALGTTIFDTTIIVGGPGSTSSAVAGSFYGQGGGSSEQYGASSFGAGKSGIIAIRNHR